MSKVCVKRMRAPTEEEEALKTRVREEMVRDRCRLIARYGLVAKLALQLELIPVVDHRLSSAATDGTRLFVNAAFYSKLDPAERLGIIAHEVWHCALRHFQRMGSRDRALWNYAADLETDFLVQKDGFKIEMLPFDPDWREKCLSAEQLYELINPKLSRFRKDDTHLYPGDETDETNEPDETNKSQEMDGPARKSDGDPADPTDASSSAENGAEGDKGDACSGRGNGAPLRPGLPQVDCAGVIDPDYRPFIEEGLEDKWKNNLKTAVQQIYGKRGRGKGIGSLPGNVAALIRDDEDAATVNWKRVLLDYVSQLFGGEWQWLPPSKRYIWKKLYLPSRAKRKEISIVLAVDTSGSTVGDLGYFMSELRGMVHAFGEYTIKIIQCDCSINCVKDYSSNDDSPPLPEEGLVFHGFGGTSLIPPFQYVEEKMKEPPNVFIYLTDGGGPAPREAPDYPVIWCLTGTGIKPAPWGLEVRIDSSLNRNGN